MRARVPVAVRNRLARLEAKRPQELPIGGWPSIMELDAWEALATRIQEELTASAHEDVQSTKPRFESVYSPPPERKADEGLGERRRMSAIEEYLEARRMRQGDCPGPRTTAPTDLPVR